MLKQKIYEDLKEAVKKKEELESLVLRSLSAVILNKEKEIRYKLCKAKPELEERELEKESQLTDDEATEAVSSEAKKRKEAISEFEKGERQDLVEKEKKELRILEKYLPEQLSEEELQKLAKEAIEKIGAKEVRDTGKVMAELMPRVKGRADGAAVSRTIKELMDNNKLDNNG